jgi:hypothetical protein
MLASKLTEIIARLAELPPPDRTMMGYLVYDY